MTRFPGHRNPDRAGQVSLSNLKRSPSNHPLWVIATELGLKCDEYEMQYFHAFVSLLLPLPHSQAMNVLNTPFKAMNFLNAPYNNYSPKSSPTIQYYETLVYLCKLSLEGECARFCTS